MGISFGDRFFQFFYFLLWFCFYVQVVGEVLEELCGQMSIMDFQEVQEFVFFFIKGEGELFRLGRLDLGRQFIGQVCFCVYRLGSFYVGVGRVVAGLVLGRMWIWVFYVGELVRFLRFDEYFNSVMVDKDVSLYSRRFGWEIQLYFDNFIYISIYYSQVSFIWFWVVVLLAI